jgi:hypothetical protein
VSLTFLLLAIGTSYTAYGQRGRGVATSLASVAEPCPNGVPIQPPVDPKAPAGWGDFDVHVGSEVDKTNAKTGTQMIQQLDLLVRRVPALNPVPPGIFIRQQHAVGKRDIYGHELVNAFYFIDFHHPLKTPSGNYDINDAYAGVWIHLNGFLRPFAPMREHPVQEPKKLGEFAGHPIYQLVNGGQPAYVFLTKRQQLPWRYLTLREYVAEERTRFEKSAPLASAPEKIKSDHEKFMAAFDQKAAAFSAAVLDAPVYLSRQGWGLDGLSTSADPSAFRLVYVNNDFLDPKLPPSAVQFITMLAPQTKGCPGLSAEILNQIDMKTLEGMLQ